MGKLLGLLLVVALIAAGAYYLMGQSETGDPGKTGNLRVEEKYGVTTQTPG